MMTRKASLVVFIVMLIIVGTLILVTSNTTADKDAYGDEVICYDTNPPIVYSDIHFRYVSEGIIAITTMDGSDKYFIGSCVATKRN